MRKINTERFRRATRDTPREVNRRILLNLVREHQPISRADLARVLDMNRGTVSTLVRELIDEGMVQEGATANAPRGRKPRLLHIRSHDRLVVGIDVRRRQTNLLLTDFSGERIAVEQFRTPGDVDCLVDQLGDRIERLLQVHADVGRCEGVGMVVPGLVDAGTGLVLNAPTLGWRDVDVRRKLSMRVPLEVRIERDAIACAMAKMWFGRKSDRLRNFVYVTVSDGVGAGIVVKGEVVRGRQHAAGEFGHIPLSLDGPLCSCGNLGCWEAYASNRAAVARYLGRDPSTVDDGPDGSDPTVEDVIARAGSGDTGAEEALRVTGEYLGVGLAGIINALSPEEIILGGEITAAWELVEPPLRAEMARRVLTRSAVETPVLPEGSDRDKRLQGAVVLVVAPTFAAPVLA